MRFQTGRTAGLKRAVARRIMPLLRYNFESFALMLTSCVSLMARGCGGWGHIAVDMPHHEFRM
jgi:hypothetical protein